MRSIGRKDRHSKVFTAKGPRDRRVRLSAHTAIQFYDVQDRLGYDRPSKAVDWLLKKAKPAIDELPELPPWKPTATIIKSPKEEDDSAQPTGSSDEVEMDDGDGKGFCIDRQDHHQQQQEQHHQQNCNNADSCGLLPPSLDSDAIADTIKSFFPMGCTTHGEVSAATSSSPTPPMQFSSYMPELMSRSHSHSQDLRLSLQSFRETMMMQSHPDHHHQAAHHSMEQQPFFPGAGSHLGFNHQSAGWPDNQPAEMGRFQRLVSSFPAGNDGGGGNGGGGFMLNSSPPSVTPMLQPSFFGQLLSQGGTLQSSYNPLIRAWINDPSISNSVMEQARSTNPYPVAGTGSAYTGGFSGFHIPARIQGEEECDGDPNKPSSTSSSSRHRFK